MKNKETRICPIGSHVFTFEVGPGRRPTYCPEHRVSNERNAIAAASLKERNKTATERHCPRCNTTKPADQFSATAPYCRPCMADWMRDHRKERPALQTRIERLRNYGITQEQFDAMFEAQGKRCKICGRTTPGGTGAGGWHVDHDHACCSARKRSCGKCLRGILCSNCNVGIGNLQDDPEIILAALQYVLAYRARRESGGHINLSAEEDAAVRN